MFYLTPENAAGYLRERNWVGPGPVRVEPLGWGVSNAVFKVHAGHRIFVLKQSRPQLRTRETWLSDLDRVYREQEVMEALHALLPEPVVPRVLFVDRPNYVFAMAHAPTPLRVWKETLLSGEIDVALAEHAGLILGRIHEGTATSRAFMERFRDHTIFVQLRVDPFYRRVQERRPEVAQQVGSIIERMLTVKEALCHGDLSPKNILTHAEGFTLVDYETAHFGDPTMDLGFFLSHLLLKSLCRFSQREQFYAATRSFWAGYAAEVVFRPLTELQARGIGHLAVCLLARIDGTSPVDYLPEEPKREAVRQLARALLNELSPTWDQVLSRCELEWNRSV